MSDIFSEILIFTAGGIFGVFLTVGVILLINSIRDEAAKWALWELEASLAHFVRRGQ